MGSVREVIESVSLKSRLALILKSVNGLKEVESLISSKTHSEAPLLTEISNYLLEIGGKRIRPALSLMSSKLFGMTLPSPQVIDVAAGIELIHMATLLHDDIIDNSPLRRHQESPYLRYGRNNTLLAGDFLLTRAFSLCARLDRFIIDATETACVALTEGEILEIPLRVKQHTVFSALDIARKKTSSLFSLACKCGAHLAGSDEGLMQNITSFGENIGISFQIIDDILDVTSTESELGKVPGSDIREQKPSLVNVLWLLSGSELASELLTSDSAPSDQNIADALSEIKGGNVIADAKKIARDFTNTARESLNRLSKSSRVNQSVLKDFETLLDYAMERGL